ncbi:MAG: hypothetical protein ACOC6P_03910 [Candidatus Aminicenantaceae bacterium]
MKIEKRLNFIQHHSMGFSSIKVIEAGRAPDLKRRTISSASWTE